MAGKILSAEHRIHKFRNRIRVAGLNIVEKDRSVKIILSGNRFRPNHDALTLDLFRHGPRITLERQKQANLKFGHRFNIFIDPTIRTGPAQILRLGHQIEFFTADLERNIPLKARVFSSILG